MGIEPPLYMQKKAKKIMHELYGQQFKLIAFIVRNGKIISVATNNPFKTHTKIHKYNPKKCIHAEISAIWKAPKNKLQGAIIYVFRLLNKIDEFALSLPCNVCQIFIYNAGIKKIIYTTNNGFALIKVRS